MEELFRSICYTYEEVKELLKKHNKTEEGFANFIFGQTGLISPSGTFGYYKSDVERFLK